MPPNVGPPGYKKKWLGIVLYSVLVESLAVSWFFLTTKESNPGGAGGPRFKVALDTHSVNLDAYNLKTPSLLRDGTGKAHEATEAENQGGGHHRTVTLHCPEIPAGTRNLELIINDVAGIKEPFFR